MGKKTKKKQEKEMESDAGESDSDSSDDSDDDLAINFKLKTQGQTKAKAAMKKKQIGKLLAMASSNSPRNPNAKPSSPQIVAAAKEEGIKINIARDDDWMMNHKMRTMISMKSK